jgi:hypothetical protein
MQASHNKALPGHTYAGRRERLEAPATALEITVRTAPEGDPMQNLADAHASNPADRLAGGVP